MAGSVPGWTGEEAQGALYQSRYLSNSGRLFFDSPDALVPADVDGVENLYEYEPEGVGNCEGTVAGASQVYERQTGGCVGLISSGTSAQESVFLDASENGDDVFFMTTSQLVPQDLDSAYDVYDAHVCSVASPCSSSAVAVPPACTTADSCRAAPVPQPAIFGPPPSATFSGTGNLAPEVAPPPKKVTKKAVKCKKGHVKNKRGQCIKNSKAKKRKAKKSNRRAK